MVGLFNLYIKYLQEQQYYSKDLKRNPYYYKNNYQI